MTSSSPLSQRLVVDAHAITKTIDLPNGHTLRLLDGVDITVHAGETVAIVGASGSGKTTLLSILGLLSRQTSGTLAIDGRDCTRVSDRQAARIRNHDIGFVFQAYSLVPHLRAAKNVELPLLYGARTRRRTRHRRVTSALDAVGLQARGKATPQELSGGEQQRVAIARALVKKPAVIFADEPTGALDVETAELVLEALHSATRHRGCALVTVTHDVNVARRMDRVLQLEHGRLAEIG